MKKNSILLISFLGFFSFANAQSAVTFCPNTAQVGYSYGGGNLNYTKSDAYQRCINGGGQMPQFILFTDRKGYGAIAIGKGYNGVVKIGSTAAATSSSAADAGAIKSCIKEGANPNTVQIRARWQDLR
jgi:hypothetical protein|nr:DUF4189 domain-containing protein [uncultured Flavobacterium sp.]